jgi:hypothetical protein
MEERDEVLVYLADCQIRSLMRQRELPSADQFLHSQELKRYYIPAIS